MGIFTKLEDTEEGSRRVGVSKEILDAKFIYYHPIHLGDSVDIAIAFKRAMEESNFKSRYYTFNWATQPSLAVFSQQTEVWLGLLRQTPKKECTFVWQGFEIGPCHVDCCTIFHNLPEGCRRSYMSFMFKDESAGMHDAMEIEVIFMDVGDDFSDLLNQFFKQFREWWASKNRSVKKHLSGII